MPVVTTQESPTTNSQQQKPTQIVEAKTSDKAATIQQTPLPNAAVSQPPAPTEPETTAPSSQKKLSPRKLSPRLIVATLVALTVSGLALALVVRWRTSQAIAADLASAKASALQTATASRSDANTITLDPQQAQSLQLEAATRQAFRAEKIATGKISFNEELMTPVYSPYAGRLVRLLAKPGDVVKAGTPLFEIDTPELVQAESDLIAANLALAKATGALEMARRAEDRQHRLYANKAVAMKDWEQAEADLKNAEREVHTQESLLAASRSRLHTYGKSAEEIAKIETNREIDRITKIASPIYGTITARKVGPGQLVKPDNPEPLFTIANLSTVWMLADVYEADIPFIKVGQPVEVRVAAYPNEIFTARISYISSSVDPTTRRIAVRSLVENRGLKLKPEMFANFHVLTGATVEALAVPVNAIFHDGEKTSVWVAQSDHRFTRHDITVGLQQGNYAQVLSGLQEGEKIVANGSLFLSNIASAQ
ncbi:MAG: efflux RND transporter periplasmic adaptor subunit [Acidobacteria bacterium]|nr:efflux RND transporter periplasmic adaptor subunit [Acidobacteriota bacterium]